MNREPQAALLRSSELKDVVTNVRGYEVLWTNGLGMEQRMLCMDRDRALIYAARYGGRLRTLVWGDEQ